MDIICDGPYVPTKVVKEDEIYRSVPKSIKDFNKGDRKKIEKNYKAKKILACDIGLDGYNQLSYYESSKDIWKALQNENQSKIDMFTAQYELFKMSEGESI